MEHRKPLLLALAAMASLGAVLAPAAPGGPSGGSVAAGKSIEAVPQQAPRGYAPPSQPLELQYHLRLRRPTTHLVEIEIDADKVLEPALDLVMPAWSPGRYAIYDFAKNVQEFEAMGAQDQLLPWTKVDKQTWHVETRDSGGKVRARYKVFANDLSGTFSQFDASHANLNGASVYMYLAGHKQDPITLTVDAPASWKLISGFSESMEQRTFQAPNYDRLIDTPIEISPACIVQQFREHEKLFRIAIHSYRKQEAEASDEIPHLDLTRTADTIQAESRQGESTTQTQSVELTRLIDSVKKMVAAEMGMMPTPDFQDYTFIFHFAPDITAGDAMEHLNSSQIMIRGQLSEASISEALDNAAHEFFHLWNVKRLRPAALGPFDYTRENYTSSLWFVEGITSYYAYVNLLRSGAWSREDFLKKMAEEIRDFEAEPGRRLMSAESSSFHAWFYDRSPQMQETNFANSTISYYNKGVLLGMLLDLEIRFRTKSQQSLDDVLRSLYARFYEAPPASYYGPGRGYEEEDILEAVNAVSGDNFNSFFDRYVRGTEPLPYLQVLGLAGLKLRVAVEPDAPPSLGALTQPVDTGVRITAVRPGGAADRAGLSRDDILTAVDELSLATEELNHLLRMYPSGAEVPFTVKRRGQRERITVKLDPPAANRYSIEELPAAPADQVNIRNGWLGK